MKKFIRKWLIILLGPFWITIYRLSFWYGSNMEESRFKNIVKTEYIVSLIIMVAITQYFLGRLEMAYFGKMFLLVHIIAGVVYALTHLLLFPKFYETFLRRFEPSLK